MLTNNLKPTMPRLHQSARPKHHLALEAEKSKKEKQAVEDQNPSFCLRMKM